jgi:regulator of sigma E protease
VGSALEGYPAAGLLEPGDTILSINGEAVDEWEDLSPLLQKSETPHVVVKVRRGEETLTVEMDTKEDEGRRLMGISPLTPPILGEVIVKPQLPAENRYLRPGDEILAVGGESIISWDELREAIAAHPEEAIELTVRRVEPFTADLLIPSERPPKLAEAGVEVGSGSRVTQVRSDSPGAKADVRAGDVVLAQEAVAVSWWRRLLRRLVGDPQVRRVRLTLRRAEPFLHRTTPVENPIDHSGALGINPKSQRTRLRFRPLRSLHLAAASFVNSTYTVVVILQRMLSRDVALSSVSGPVGIAQAAGEHLQRGAYALFNLTAMLSVNLAIINLLPIPLLDGSLLIIFLLEGIRRRPVSRRVQWVLQYLGLFILIPLILYVTYHDLVRMIQELIG